MSQLQKDLISLKKKGQVSPNKGKTFSEEHKLKLSLAKKGKPSKLKGIKKIVKDEEWNIKRRKYVSEKNKRWTENNYQKKLWQNNKRRVFKMNAGGFHTLGEWENLKVQYNFTCPACGKQEPIITLSRDHIIPLSKGGSDNIENIQPLCRLCNSTKSTKCIRY